jgi:hypothetical protein
MNIIQLQEAPSQEFDVGENNRLRLNYNYAVNMWSFSLFDSAGVALSAGDFLDVGTNLLAAIGERLIVADAVSCPQSNWYDRLVKVYADGIPQTVLVYDV